MKEKLKNIKGITLIALVITIIVMIILVAVSVTVALQGGLFTTAKTASNKTELEKDKELLMAAAVGALGEDGKVVYANIQLPEGFEKTSDGTYTKDGYTFIVDQYGRVTVNENTDGKGEWAYVEEIDHGDLYKCLYYIGNNKEFKLSSQVTAEVYTESFEETDEFVNKNIEEVDSIIISSDYNPETEIVDLNGSNINLNNIYISLADNTSIKELKGLDGLTELSEGTVWIYNCSRLNKIDLPSSLTSLGYYAIGYCNSIESIKIPNSVTSISGTAFPYCTSLTSIEIDNTENAISGSPWGATNATVTWLR